jgi:hypothetical protein
VELSFGTTVIGIVDGGKPMGGENNWFCIFEADWGCMVTYLFRHNSFAFTGKYSKLIKIPLSEVTLARGFCCML